MRKAGIWCVCLLALSIRVTAEEREHVVVFHWNDLHGKIGALPKIARLVQEAREGERNVFVLVAGDSFTGNPYVDQHSPKGRPILELYNSLGVDVSALGNHEFDYGQEILGHHLKEARFRFVCANLDVGQSGLVQPPPTATLRTAAGSEIVVLGLIQVGANGLPDTHPDRLQGLRFEAPMVTAQGLAERQGALIALTHLGFDEDVRLAEAVPRIDVIIGGHSHTVVRSPELHNGVLVAQAGSNGAFLGRIDLELSDGRVVSKRGSLIDLSATSDEDAALRAQVERFTSDPELNRVVADGKVALVGKSELGSLMADAVRQEAGLEMAFTNSGAVRMNELPSRILLSTVYQLDPFGNQVVRFALRPAEIRSLIRTSYERAKGIDLLPSGLQYTVTTNPDGSVRSIELRNEEGAPLEEAREYQVGLSSYVASAYTFDHRDSGQSQFVTTSACLVRYLEKSPDLSRYKGIVRASVQAER